MDYSYIIGQNLKMLRTQAGLTQMQTAQAIGVSYQQIQKYESGTNRLSAEKLYQLKSLYGADFSAFFAGVDRTAVAPGARGVGLSGLLNAVSDDDLRRKLEKVLLIFLED